MIDWPTVVTTILASSSIAVIIVTVIGFVAKSIISRFLDKDLERFRTNLEKSVFEHQTRYHNLHSKRVEVIEKLYQLLVQAERDIILLTHPFQSGEPSLNEKSSAALISARESIDFFEKNRIYFRPDSCKRISGFIRELSDSLIQFQYQVQPLINNSQSYMDGVGEWVKVLDRLTKQLPSIKTDIENEFRGILGLN